MEERKFEVIKFHISEKGKRAKVDMSKINEEEDFLSKLFKEFVPFIDNYPKDESKKTIVKMPKNENGKPFFKKLENARCVTGIIETGKYGKENSVSDIENKEEAVFKIKKEHSVQKPFFFLICVSNINENGIILLERIGGDGIKSIFIKVLKKFTQESFPNLNLHTSNHIDKEVVKKYINEGEYRSIKLTRNSIPSDVGKRYDLSDYERENYTIELIIKSKKGKPLFGNTKDKILRIFKETQNTFFESPYLQNVGFDDNSKINLVAKYNGNKRTIDLSDTMKFKPYYNCQVEVDATGHSNYLSIEKKGLELLQDLKLGLY